MAWIAPKTNWQPTDTFDLVPDYARIRGNILHLHGWAARLHLPFSLAVMKDYGIAEFPEVAFFQNVDSNADKLLDGTFRPVGAQKGRIYKENGPVWSAADLNRIESALLQLSQTLQGQENARNTLKFTLGGGAFGSLI